MDSVIILLKDPSWWFSAVFVGLLISVLGSYFRDGLTLIFSKFSKTFQIYSKKKIVENKKYINFLVSNPDILAIEITKILLSIAICLILILIYFSLPAILYQTEEMRVSSYDKYVVLLLMICNLAYIIRLGWVVTFKTRIVMFAYRKYYTIRLYHFRRRRLNRT